MTGAVGWLGLAAGVLLLRGRRGVRAAGLELTGADPPAGRRAAGVQRSPPLLAPVAGVAVAVALSAFGGRLGWIVAAPAAIAVVLLLRRTLGAAAVADPRSVAFVLDLIACALRAGSPPELALTAVAKQVTKHGTDSMRRAVMPLQLVGRLLALGSEPAQAWSVLESIPAMATVGEAGRRCADSGARLAGALTETATELREQHRAEAIARAERIGVWALLPLGCCFLPAFVCLGVVPVVAGVAGQVLGNSP